MNSHLTETAQLSDVSGPLSLAIGVFDGVHLGHQAVLARALSGAREHGGSAVAVTFNPHPLRVLRPSRAPRLLTSTTHKLRLIRSLGIEHLLVIPFDPEFASTPPERFIRALAKSCRPLREICVGHQWSFGRDRAGNLGLLHALGPALGFQAVGVPPVQIDGEIVSSTLVRGAVEGGDLARAARLLGRDYTILGTVVPGDQRGRQLGFPTANLAAHNEQFPPNGVYAIRAARDGGKLHGVANIGVRPTIASPDGQRLLEVHLFDFAEDIYGEDLEITFLRFIRPEQKFASLESLRAQIGRDVALAKNG